MKKLVTLVSLILVAVVSAQEESTLLRLNYNEGDKYVMEMHMNEISEGKRITEIIFEIPIKITGINEEIYNSEMIVKRIKMSTLQQGDMKLIYDSESKEENKEENLELEHKSLIAKMKLMLETVLESKTNIYREVLERKTIKGSIDVDGYVRQVESMIYPKEAVTVGYSWASKKYDENIKTTKTYTVKSITANEVIVDLKGRVSGSSSFLGFTTGSMTGVINIDKTSGVLTESNVNTIYEVIGQKIHSEVIIKMKKVD